MATYGQEQSLRLLADRPVLAGSSRSSRTALRQFSAGQPWDTRCGSVPPKQSTRFSQVLLMPWLASRKERVSP